MEEIVGVVGVGVGAMTGSWKLSVTDFVTLLTVTVTTTGPATEEVTVAFATPLVVVRINVVGLSGVSVKLAFAVVVANSTAVPFGTGALFCVTVAVIVEVEPVNGAAVVTVRAMLAPVGGGVPPLLPVPFPLPLVPVMGGGAVGDSPLQPAKSASSAMSARRMNRCVVCFMSTPVNSSSTPTPSGREGPARRLETAAAVEAEVHRKPGRTLHALTVQRFAVHGEDDVHLHKAESRLRILAAVLRQECGERRLIECIRLEREKIAEALRRPGCRQYLRRRPDEGRRNELAVVRALIRHLIAVQFDVVEIVVRR